MEEQPSADAPTLTPNQLADLRAAEAAPPNTADIPEAPAANWAHARRFFKPRKEAISLRLDADVLDWLRRRHERYQPAINRILREKMEAEPGFLKNLTLKRQQLHNRPSTS